jgi:Phosphatidylglycerophosphate synthase
MKHYLRFIPNLISLVRISLVIPTVLNLLAGEYIFALILFAIASISDAIDGFLARFFKWQTDLGKILDPVADKLLMIGSITALWLNQIVPLSVFIIFVLRDLLILLGAAFEMSITEKTPTPNLIGKITTASQIIYILGLIIFEIFNVDINDQFFHILIAFISLLSLISYFRWWLNNNFIKQNV